MTSSLPILLAFASAACAAAGVVLLAPETGARRGAEFGARRGAEFGARRGAESRRAEGRGSRRASA